MHPYTLRARIVLFPPNKGWGGGAVHVLFKSLSSRKIERGEEDEKGCGGCTHAKKKTKKKRAQCRR